MTKRHASLPHWRFIILGAFFSLLSLGLIARLFSLQVMDHENYVAKAEDQYGTVRTISATRGTIRTSDGFDLATTQPAYTIIANPNQIQDPQTVASQVAQILQPTPTPTPVPTVKPTSSPSPSTTPTPTPVPTQKPLTLDQQIAQLVPKLSDKHYYWVPIGRKVDETRTNKIKNLKIKGLYYEPEQERYYPEGSLASQVLGFVGEDAQGNDQGYYGIEGYFDRDLRGKDGKVALEQDPQGNPIPVGKYNPKPVENGADITLTINRGLQFLIEQKMATGVQSTKSESGSVILMEPKTGRILAMANYPTYNPTDWSSPEVQQKQLFKNSAIADAYEPGSVLKTFTSATGIELGLFGPSSTYFSAPYKVGDHTITTADDKYYGTATLTQMLEHSDNTGAAQFGMKIGKQKFLQYLHNIGLDRPTGITLEGEGDSIIPAPSDWLPITLATASFGQGVSVTALQLLEEVATIANDGVQMKPTIISSVSKNGQTTEVKPETVGRIYSHQTSQEMAEMLQQVVQYGEFRHFALQGYHIAGKTSTAQIPLKGGYDPDHVITTFVGYAPADDPKFIMLVKLNKPAILNSAQTVVPVWMDMAKDLFQYYGMSPDPSNFPVPTPTPTAQP